MYDYQPRDLLPQPTRPAARRRCSFNSRDMCLFAERGDVGVHGDIDEHHGRLFVIRFDRLLTLLLASSTLPSRSDPGSCGPPVLSGKAPRL